MLEIWKSKMAAASDVIMLMWLPWKPIKQQVVPINWKYKERSLYTDQEFQTSSPNSKENGALIKSGYRPFSHCLRQLETWR